MINVIGLGYIGLPTALILAANNVEIIGTDFNEELVSTLNGGELTFEEDGLADLFDRALNKGIKFSTKYQKTDAYIVAVPTPYDSSTKKIDAHYIMSAVEQILNVCNNGATIIIESTISPGTIDKIVKPMIKAKGLTVGKDIHLAHAPERIIPGNMLNELVYNNRTIGVDEVEIGKKIEEIYSSFCKGEIVITDIRTAEMTKVVENTFRDVNIAFANELAKICRADDMDVYEIIKIANKHPRVNILSPGPGVGGHCIPVDPWFLVGDYPILTNLILEARKTNDSMPEFVLERVYEIMKENNIQNVDRVGFYGLTYKENIDDLRESPTLQMLSSMQKHLSGNAIKVYDPFIKTNIVPNQLHDLDTFLDSVDLVVILVSHSEIKENITKLQNKIVLDTRKVCDFEGVYRI